MPCYKPMHGYRSKEKTENGKHTFTTSVKLGNPAFPMTIPCGYCIGCRLEKSRQWAVRCMHEAKMHEKNCFITLTFNDTALQNRKHKNVDKRDFQLFIKRLRKQYGSGIRYYHCGEYGDKFGRPHYHACIFGFDFPDKKPWKNSLYRSKELERLWPYGYSSIGAVTFETAAYVARYVLKKKYGKQALEHYNEIDYTTGEILNERSPEYTTMSRRPGIAKLWYEKFQSDVYPRDHVIVRGRECKPPRYYDKLFELAYPSDYQKIKCRRKINSIKKRLDTQAPSLQSQEACALARVKQLKRSYENET